MPHDVFYNKSDGASPAPLKKKSKLGWLSGVYIPVLLNILSILMFLRFGSILGRIGLFGILGLLVVAYLVDLTTTLSLSAIASNGEVKGGGAYYLISRSLGPEFGGSIGVLFYLSQVLNTSLNVVGLIDCLKLNLPDLIPHGYWEGYVLESSALLICAAICVAGSAFFTRASSALVVVLVVATLSIPFSTLFQAPFKDPQLGVHFTGLSLKTLQSNLYPHPTRPAFRGMKTFRELFGVLFPATSGIFAGASMSGDLRNPSKAIPKGTLWAMLSTFVLYTMVIMAMASSISHDSLLKDTNIVYTTNIWPPMILAGECATTFFSALMGIVGAAKLLQALGRDKILPGCSIFGKGIGTGDEPLLAIFLTWAIAQLAFFADLNQIATLISMGYQMTFFVMNLACFLLKIGSAPNFRPAFKFFNWQTAFSGSIFSAAAMFFIDEAYSASAICAMIFIFLLIHYLSPPKHWGDVSQNLIYHQVRKYLLRLKPEHIKFWRPQIILLINDPRHHTRLIQFCNSLKKGSLYILGHVIVTDDFNTGIHEAKLQQSAWYKYIAEYSRIKAFVQLTMSPSIEWGIRNLILSAGLGGMRPNIAVIGFYNLEELRATTSNKSKVPEAPASPTKARLLSKAEGKLPRRRRGDTTTRLLEGFLPTDTIRTESSMSVKSYLTILEDLTLRHRLNVAIGKGFQGLESPRRKGDNSKRFIDLWPIQMSAEIMAGDKNILTSNFDTYTLILQLGYILLSVPTWKKDFQLRVLVFVEYECEVEDERARVQELLEKLRIDAQVVVFWLASGELRSYEAIINGDTNDSETLTAVDEILREEEWWLELKRLRSKESAEVSRTEELASLEEILDGARRRNSLPHEGGDSPRKQVSLGEIPKKPTVSAISKLGANFGIRTHHLDPNAFEDGPVEGIDDYSSDDEGGPDISDAGDFNDLEDAAPELSQLQGSPRRHRLLSLTGRYRSHSIFGQDRPNSKPSQETLKPWEAPKAARTGYGAIDFSRDSPRRHTKQTSSTGKETERSSLLHTSLTGSTLEGTSQAPENPPSQTPVSRASSLGGGLAGYLTPGNKVTGDDITGRSITFSQPEKIAAPKLERPPLSRNSSMGRFSSRPVPEMKVESDDTGGAPRLMFAEPEPRLLPTTPATPGTPVRSRKSSFASGREGRPAVPGTPSADAHLNMSELQDSYYRSAGEGQADEGDGGSGGSSYSTQSMPLSFNDLPSRAQHLILNELMRQNSRDQAAVLLTTLPIPEEGTCTDEDASLRYLSDVEVLCHELPPTLLVLSNNMTVTVGL